MSDIVLYELSSVEAAINYLTEKQGINFNSALDKPLRNILSYLKDYHNVMTMVVENNYIDKDYSNELSFLYSKTFRHRKGYCTRLHFFANSFADYDEFIRHLDYNKGYEYLGFMVLRPLQVGKVGRTLIRPKTKPNGLDNLFYLCIITRDVHIHGHTLQAEGIPFIEQDGMVMNCAQASIWVVAKYMHYAYSHIRYLPYEITDKAASSFSYLGRPIPSSGLTLEQMTSALNNMGYSPILYDRPRRADYYDEEDGQWEERLSSWNPLERIYPYIESGVPVLIGFDDHVCSAIGHKMYDYMKQVDKDKLIRQLEKQEKELQSINKDYVHRAILPSSVFTDALIIHNDKEGIYRILPSDQSCNILLQGDYENLFTEERWNVQDDVNSIIVPLPDKIYLLAEDAYSITCDLLDPYIESFNLTDYIVRQADKGNMHATNLAASLYVSLNNPIILRTYFIKSTEFKRRVKGNKNINAKVRNYYVMMDMPRFIWAVEISTFSIYSSCYKIYGEILFDSTANKYDSYGSILAAHLPGFFFQNEIITGSIIKDEEIEIEEPYIILSHCALIECTHAE